MSKEPYVGQRVSYGGALCTVRYVGEVAGTTGSWLGVEWDDPTRGKHDGSHKGVDHPNKVNLGLSRSSTAASFVRPTRPKDDVQGFLSALREKYVSDPEQDKNGQPDAQIIISGTKVAEEVGFDKIWKKLAQVKDLKVVILDGMRIAVSRQDGDDSIAESCPNITHVDLSRNLFETIGPVADICAELKTLRKLSIDGNRFQGLLQDAALDRLSSAFRGVAELSLQETLLTWEEVCAIAVRCPSLRDLNAGSNQLTSLAKMDYLSLSSTLTSINLEFNDFTCLSDLASLTRLTSLRNLNLKGNNIAAITAHGVPSPVFPPSLQYLDLSYNNISAWSFVDLLPAHFPGLNALRLSHNPVYNAAGSDDTKASSSEESHMLTIGRLANLQSLNYAQVKAADRTNAEMFYLSRIAKQLAAVPESAEHTVLAQHPRYGELCAIYGEPDVVRRDEINPNFLEARLISVTFHLEGAEKRTCRIPKSFDVYAVKGIAGKLFDLPPLKVKLVWETGEWDPVAGYDDGDGDSSDDEDLRGGETAAAGADEDVDGRWIEREVELKDGPKQLGYCVDGLDVSIRIERR
ncbi:Cytoskeleton-associated protein, Gly-rich domain protein [Metarhizium album ARSEF 1941]|uniref:Cytoskeleton-associated protein, Gly-rich domain protein n=1 Tax=Metarhizium album (strain ARSEF 1941) TaxID=1081103 RepID=A0A0B2X2X3_METAS|nr:Cytoskeleton-associated protein, Gly-rich domain protein [Metarhizium album ARSEF 1941]KHO00108.1 Cytoskeleton-associated protein, Gly-rich domain protein [Metarhizium album ARSEF 1941]